MRWVLALLAAIVGAAPMGSVHPAGLAPVSCRIMAEAVTGGVRLVGVATSSADMAASYSLLAEKSGASGNSRLIQNGDAVLTASGDTQLGEMFIGIQRGDVYSAQLDVMWPGGTASCMQTGEHRS